MTSLTVFECNGTLVIDSRLLALRLGIEHESFVRTIKTYQSLIEQEFGFLRFEIGEIQGRGQPVKYYLLNENQATFLMTLSRNTLEVVHCKLELVKAFDKAKQLLQQQPYRSQASLVSYWAERQRLFILNTTIPDGWFCIFQELAQLMWQLENFGYVIPDYSPVTKQRIMPDISIGRMFCKYLGDEGLIVEEIVEKYPHWYPNWEYPVKANIYPDDLLKDFRAWFNGRWKPERLIDYLGERDPDSLPPISKLLGLPESPIQMELFQMRDGLFLVLSDEID